MTERLLPRLICLAVLLPAVPLCAEVRTWTDSTGQFKIQAEFIRVDGQKVVLKDSTGQTREIPLDRLSEPDQQHVRQLMKAAPANPFAIAADSGASAGGGRLEVKWDGQEIQLASAGNRWEVNVTEPPTLDYPPRTVGLPKKRDFFEGGTGTVVNTQAQRAMVSYALEGRGRSRGRATTSRIVLADIGAGKLLANAEFDGKWSRRAIHDDGRLILAKHAEGEEAGLLATCEAQGDQLKVLDEWIPYQHLEGKSRGVRFLAFAINDRLVTCNEPGNVAVWDFKTRQQICNFSISRTSIPAVSPDGRYLAYAGGNEVGVFNLETLEPVGLKAANKMDFWVGAVFSPSGKRFAAASHHALTVWDSATGEELFHGAIPGLNTAFGFDFPAEDFVLISKEYLVEFATGIKVWQYAGGAPQCESGWCFYGADNSLVPVQIPHPEALRLLTAAKEQDDLFVVKKGSSVSLDLSGVPDAYRAEVEQGLKQQLAKVGCQVAPSAKVVVKAEITGPKPDKISYFRLGDFDFKKYSSSLTYEYEGKTIWKGGATNVPGMLFEKRDKSYQQQIDEAASRPNLHYYKTVTLPDYLQKPSAAGDAKPGAQQTIGVTKLTSNGL